VTAVQPYPIELAEKVLGEGAVPRWTFDIGVDIDDVLHPWSTIVHDLCYAAGLHDGSPYEGGWKMFEHYGCTEEEWGEVIGRAIEEGGLYDAPPIPEAVEGLRRLKWLGHRIHLVTARGFLAGGEEIKRQTELWVPEYAVPCDSLTFSKDKAAVANELGLDFFIDDGVHNFEAIQQDAKNCEPYLLSAAHNRDYWTPFRLETMDEFVELVIAASSEEGKP
jgi:hypothetical protein